MNCEPAVLALATVASKSREGVVLTTSISSKRSPLGACEDAFGAGAAALLPPPERAA